MSKRLRYYGIVLVVGLLIIAIVIQLLIIKHVPGQSESVYDYVSQVNRRYPGVHWTMADFRPVYLWTHKKDGKHLMLTAYRSREGKLKLTNVLLGGQVGDFDIPLSKFRKNGSSEVVQPVDISDYRDNFKVGQRVDIRFFVDVHTGPPGNPTSLRIEEGKELCKLIERTCQIVRIIDGMDDDNVYTNFVQTGELTKNVNVPALFVGRFVK